MSDDTNSDSTFTYTVDVEVDANVRIDTDGLIEQAEKLESVAADLRSVAAKYEDGGEEWDVPDEYDSLVEWVRAEGLFYNDITDYEQVDNGVRVVDTDDALHFGSSEQRRLSKSPFEVVEGDPSEDTEIVVAPEGDGS